MVCCLPRWAPLATAVALAGCRPPAPASPAPAAPGSLVVRAFALADSTRPTRMLDAWAWPAGAAGPGADAARARADAGNEARLGPLPAGRYVVRAASIGYDRQQTEVEVRAGCTDTLTVLMPTVTGDIGPPSPPRVGRWRAAGCPPGA